MYSVWGDRRDRREREIKAENKHLSCSLPAAPGHKVEQGEDRRGEKKSLVIITIILYTLTHTDRVSQRFD